MSTSATLKQIYSFLLETYGPQHWWPADTPFEVMLGAVLTQNTSWSGAEKAITELRSLTALNPLGITTLSNEEIEQAIRPSGYYRQKTDRIRTLCLYCLEKYEGDVEQMKTASTDQLRKELLSLSGIGPETADSILLYAFGRPVFVVDAYTVRLCSRLGLCDGAAKYDIVQSTFMEGLKPDATLYNEFHALIVHHSKTHCRKTSPQCIDCVLLEHCKYGSISVQKEGGEN
jgi:endonuclease-3 related protein